MKISVYPQVAVRQQHCCRCGVIQQLFALHSINRGTSASEHQHSQHSDFGKHPPLCSTGGRSGLSRLRGTGQDPLQRIHRFHRQHTHGAGEVQTRQSAPNWTSQSRGRDSASRQSATTWFKWQRSNTNLYLASTYLPTGESLLVHQAGKKPDDKRLGIRSRRRTAPSAPSVIRRSCLRGTGCHHGDSTTSSSRYGEHYFPPNVSLAALFGQTPDD